MRLPQPGDLFVDKYEIVEVIARGGFGRVFRALHQGMDRQVAIKILAPVDVPEGDFVVMSQEELLSRFRREARLISRLQAPSTITLYDFGQTPDGIPFMVMEFIEGRTLAAVAAADGPMPAERVATLLAPVLESLREAHGLGIVHRDVKPQNIMVRRGWAGQEEVKVLDFGVARVQGEWAATMQHTAEGQALGTVRYIAPEVLRGERPTPACDVYAVGLVAWELLTGHHPIGSLRPTDIIREQISPRPFRLPADLPVPDGFRAWVDGMVSKDPATRPADAGRALEALLALHDELAPTSVVSTHPPARPALPATVAVSTRGASAQELEEPTSRWQRPAEGEDHGETVLEGPGYARELIARAEALALAELPTAPRSLAPSPPPEVDVADVAEEGEGAPPTRASWPLRLVAVLVLALGLVGVTVWVVIEVMTPEPAGPPPIVAEAPPEASPPAPDTADPHEPAAAREDTGIPEPAKVVIIRTEPPFGQVEIDGRPLGQSPLALPLDGLALPVKVVGILDGQRRETTIERDDVVEVVLDFTPRPPPEDPPVRRRTAPPRRSPPSDTAEPSPPPRTSIRPLD